MILQIISVLILSCVSGILYRLGGSAKKGDSLDILRHTKTRDIGCAAVTFVAMTIVADSRWYLHIASFLLLFSALTTYWDWIFTEDNYYAHGFGCAAAYIPYLLSGLWVPCILRMFVLAALMGIWCDIFEDDIVEEAGRGFFLTATVLLFLL